jgi:hypothetical protein
LEIVVTFQGTVTGRWRKKVALAAWPAADASPERRRHTTVTSVMKILDKLAQSGIHYPRGRGIFCADLRQGFVTENLHSGATS